MVMEKLRFIFLLHISHMLIANNYYRIVEQLVQFWAVGELRMAAVILMFLESNTIIGLFLEAILLT